MIAWTWNNTESQSAAITGPGHIAVIEKIIDDTVYYSQSGLSVSTPAYPAAIGHISKNDLVVGKYLRTTSYKRPDGSTAIYKVHFQGIIYNPYLVAETTEIHGSSSSTTIDTETTESSDTTYFSDDCEDQDNPYVPDEYVTGEGIKPED